MARGWGCGPCPGPERERLRPDLGAVGSRGQGQDVARPEGRGRVRFSLPLRRGGVGATTAVGRAPPEVPLSLLCPLHCAGHLPVIVNSLHFVGKEMGTWRGKGFSQAPLPLAGCARGGLEPWPVGSPLWPLMGGRPGWAYSSRARHARCTSRSGCDLHRHVRSLGLSFPSW